jgi:3-oxoacyl-[acyl-carrier protein] reductase
MLLQNKTAVVYGASGAVGAAVAEAFAREGARVFLAGRTRARLQAVADRITAAGGQAEVATSDVLDGAAVSRHAQAVVDAAGRLDVAFNAVGVDSIVLGTPIVEMDADTFVQPITDMMRAQFNTARAVAGPMTAQQAGVILTVTSLHSKQAIPFFGAGGIIQAAIEGFCRQLAGELGPQGVRVVCVCSAGSPDAPSMQEVGKMLAATSGQSPEEMEAHATSPIPLRRFPMLAEVANVAALMASDHASAVTGAVANVTCGAVVD